MLVSRLVSSALLVLVGLSLQSFAVHGARFATGTTATADYVLAGSAQEVLSESANPAAASDQNAYANSVVGYQIYGTGNTHTDPSTVLGPPSCGTYDLSLGGGWVVVDMGFGEEIANGEGADLKVYESDSGCGSGEASPYEAYAAVSATGPWFSLGRGSGVSSFDLQGTGLTSARFIKVEDRSSGQPDNSNPTPGADIDAFEALYMSTPPEPATYSISGRITLCGDGITPISGVTVSTQSGGSATSDTYGYYTIGGLSAGTYTVTPSSPDYAISPPSRIVNLLTPPGATGQNFTGTTTDLSIDSVAPIQVVTGAPLVRGKATGVAVTVRKDGLCTADDVSVQISADSTTYSRFFVAEPDSQGPLVADNTAHPLSFGGAESVKTVYFFDSRLTPTGNAMYVSAEVDYDKKIPELIESNNTAMPPSSVVSDIVWSDQAHPDLSIHYFRTDWGISNPISFDSYFRTTSSFLKGVYPVSESMFTTSSSTDSVDGDAPYDTTSFRGLDGKLDPQELILWLRHTLRDMKEARPNVDRFVATVPSGWFDANKTVWPDNRTPVGVHPNEAALNDIVVAEARATTRPNGASIVAHEIGHSYGLDNGCEEYADCNQLTRRDGIGDYASAGLWIEKRIPIGVTESRKVYCFMGKLTDSEYWVDAEDYTALLSHKATADAAVASLTTQPAVLAVGVLNIDGSVALGDWYVLPDAALSTPLPGPYSIEFLDAARAVLYEWSFTASFEFEGFPLSQSPFVLTIPYVEGTAKALIKHDGVVVAERSVSANAPVVTLTTPNGREKITAAQMIQWTGSDVDGDRLSYSVLFSRDGGATWDPLASGLTTTSYSWETTDIAPGTEFKVRVIASDGFNTGQDTSDGSFTVMSRVYLPYVSRPAP